MSETVLKGGISYTEGEIEYIWHTEDGACEKCQALNGLTFKNTDKIPDKPHPNCRCWVEVNDGKDNDYQNFQEPPEDDELCDCWDKIQEIMDDVNELDGDIKSEMDEIEEITNNASSSIITIENLKNKIKSIIPTFKIDITNEAELRNKVKEIIKDSENAKQVFKIFDDYKIEMEKKLGHTDKYYHTKANCDSAQLGILQAGWAMLFSIGKEIKDYKYKIKHTNMAKEEIFKDCMQDLDVDWQGILQEISGKSCKDKAIEMENKYPYN
ncbi:hypothetical protein IJX73_01020 [bacterium]|nr:hypothetical protein [bacterium]